MADARLDNLKRWMESETPEQWVDAHNGRWAYSDWLALLDQLRQGEYWPMSEEDIGAHLQSLAADYRRRRNEIPPSAAATAPAGKALAWYVGGLSIIGLTSGFFAGASHTPIIGTLLPLLFALIGGASGLYIANADWSAAASENRVLWLGRALAGFGLACLIGSATGIALRLHFEESYRGNEITQLSNARTQEQLQLVALRTKLRLLGVSHDEETAILSAAMRALRDAATDIPPGQLQEVLTRSRQLKTELQALRDNDAKTGGTTPDDAATLINQLERFSHQMEPWLHSGMPRDLYKNSIETVFFHLSRIAMPHDDATAAWIQRTGFDTKNLYAFFAAIHAEFRLRDDLDWELGGDTSDKLDKFLQWASKATQRHSDAKEVAPAIDMDAKPASAEGSKGEKKEK